MDHDGNFRSIQQTKVKTKGNASYKTTSIQCELKNETKENLLAEKCQ